MNIIYVVLVIASVLCFLVAVGCAPRGRPLRPTLRHTGDPAAGTPAANAWYIESVNVKAGQPVSCSFVEFDERGDYLDFQQHRHAYSKIRTLAESGPIFVVIYVHGWKNNSQSMDVVRFNKFLHDVAASPFATNDGLRVHGVYLAWRGNSFPHALDEDHKDFKDTAHAFGGQPIVDRRYSRKLTSFLYWIPEQLSYWSRKNAAEDKVSGLGLVRTIFTCGHTARLHSKPSTPNRVFLMGHSFGALMLEQSFAPASLARLITEWPLEDKALTAEAKANPLPFDLVLLVNSAAPSIYAKQFHDYMVANRQARREVAGADAPLVISLTSTADWATGIAHKYGNLFASCYPSLWRSYDGGDFILAGKKDTIKIPQAYYYRRTPGHNPLLVDHWIVPAQDQAAATESESILDKNIDSQGAAPARTFQTSARKHSGSKGTWQITTVPPDPKWSAYKGIPPVFLVTDAIKSGYWIVRCQKEIIRGHNDVWSRQAMETYAALWRETESLRAQQPNSPGVTVIQR